MKMSPLVTNIIVMILALAIVMIYLKHQDLVTAKLKIKLHLINIFKYGQVFLEIPLKNS